MQKKLQGLLLDAARFFWRNLYSIAHIILPFTIPLELFGLGYHFLVGEAAGNAGLYIEILLGAIVYPIYAAALIFFMATSIAGQSVGVRDCWRLGVKYWWPFFLLYLAVTFAIAAGLLLLIVPGLIVMARLAFAEFELLLNSKSPIESLNASWEATKPYMWTVLGGYVVLAVVLIGPFVVFGAIMSAFDIESPFIDSLLGIVYSVVGVLFTIFAFRVYYEAGERAKESSPAPSGDTS